MLKKIISGFRKIKKAHSNVAKFMQLMQKIKPVGNYEDLPIPTAPDYSDLKYWAAHPDVFNKSKFAPKGYKSLQDIAEADVFFIHPTTFFGAEHWNAPLDHAPSKEFVDEMVMPGQASAFNAVCRIFAPRYQQATFYSFVEGGKNGRKALEFAYQDVAVAFDYYIKNWNNGRPFFIAAHSQGTLHGMRLLEEKIENSDLLEQLVAAYLPGFRFPLDKMGTAFKNLKISQHATDTGCIIAWDTYGENGSPGHRLEKVELWYSTPNGKGQWKRRSYRKPVCINPLSWKPELGKVANKNNKGAVTIELDGVGKSRIDWNAMWNNRALGLNTTGLSAPFPAEVSAEIRKDNFLYISRPEHIAFRRTLLPRGNYHLYDYALFYMDIRENVKARFAAFQRSL